MFRILRISQRKDGLLICDILCYDKKTYFSFYNKFIKNKQLNVQEVVK